MHLSSHVLIVPHRYRLYIPNKEKKIKKYSHFEGGQTGISRYTVEI